MTNEVIKILNTEATGNKFKVLDSVFGDIHLQRKQAIDQSTGAVYGILVESDAPPKDGMLAIKGYPKLYPVYWGKDIAPVSRLKAHVQNHQSTGNANLRGIKEIQGKRLIFGAIFVEKYLAFETHLHLTYPPIKGTRRAGRKSTIIKIVK